MPRETRSRPTQTSALKATADAAALHPC